MERVQADMQAANKALEQAREEQAQRKEVLRAALDAAAPLAASQAVPNSFMSAVVLDVARSVSLVPTDERVQVAPSTAKTTAAITSADASQATKPRQQAIIM